MCNAAWAIDWSWHIAHDAGLHAAATGRSRMKQASLRLRLFAIILVPLLLTALAVAAWRVDVARRTAEGLYDRNLLFTALAVARDVALFDGDAISRDTETLLGQTAGGPVRYHVYAPDGVFVTGYAVPPVPSAPETPFADDASSSDPANRFTTFDGIYKGRKVRVLRMRDLLRIGGIEGIFTVTVWQDSTVSQTFVNDQVLRALGVMAVLIGTVAILLWFGVKLGLKPLLELEDAISRRNAEDLSPIRRSVPIEARGIVQRLNHLFGQVSNSIDAQNNFVSDAAHQLRNPIAGIRAMADSITTAPSLDVAHRRGHELVSAATHASDLANRLLTLERVRSGAAVDAKRPLVLAALCQAAVDSIDVRACRRGVRVNFDANGHDAVLVSGDALMLGEALENLLDNVLEHGGDGLTRATVRLDIENEHAVIWLCDDGVSVSAEAVPIVMARFGQGEPGSGSGLGLPIAEAVARHHGGQLTLLPGAAGLCVKMSIRVNSATS